jgi:hypothetical protein
LLLAQPDAFSRHALYSRTEGSAEPQLQGGTLRFDLDKNHVLLVRTRDFHVIYEAIRFDKKSKGTLLDYRWPGVRAARLSRSVGWHAAR